jgi:hypothetical protein
MNINRGFMPDCRRMILHYAYLIRKKHHPRSNLVQINGSTEGNGSNGNSINYFDANYKDFDSTSIPINQFPAYVGRMHKDGDFGFVRLFEVGIFYSSIILFHDFLLGYLRSIENVYISC